MRSTALALSLTGILLAGQVAQAANYDQLATGKLSGKLIVQWLEPDVFLFIPDKESPLTFQRSNGKTISPGRMLTDGGSIPRPLWAFRSYSPWGYAPAFIVHDWLFHLNNCRRDNFAEYNLTIAAEIMGEIIKTMMENGKAERDPFTVDMMTTAVTSRFAVDHWENGPCIAAPVGFDADPVMEYVLDFD